MAAARGNLKRSSSACINKERIAINRLDFKPGCIGSACPAYTSGAAGQAFAQALQAFAAAQCLITEEWPPSADVHDKEIFDFIIVGAGSAGAVIANRLSEEKNWKVLLLEAGIDPPLESIVPLMDKGLFNTKHSWNYTTVNDGYVDQGKVNGTCGWIRGKMLGGSSSINGMIYMRGHREDYQAWYNAGNEDWHPDVVLEYFKKSEKLEIDEFLSDPQVSPHHGTEGTLAITNFNYPYPDIRRNVIEACNYIGMDILKDFNTFGQEMGVGRSTATIDKGKRASTAKAFLTNIKERNNLKIMKNALVTKIIFGPFKKRAIGVNVNVNGKPRKILVKKEVIVCAGAINTPQLLMLSGIGPKNHLEDMGINVIADLPVGKNLQDHLIVPILIYGNTGITVNENKTYFDAIRYLYDQTGSFSSFNFIDFSAYYATNSTVVPEFQTQGPFFPKGSEKVEKALMLNGYNSQAVQSIVNISKEHDLFYFFISLLHPESRGEILLQSKDPLKYPLIYANYFDVNDDLEKTVDGIEYFTRIINSTYFQSINAFIGRIYYEPCNKFDFLSRDYWKCISMNFVGTYYHPVGTAKMGPASDVTTVVDSKLFVHGFKNIRVADASIMPTLISGNTNAPTIMIGERAADLIKEYYKSSLVNLIQSALSN